MKKVLVFVMVFFTLSGIWSFAATAQDEESKDTLCNDVIITAIAPAIDKAIDDYYKTIWKYTPGYGPSYAKITNIERPNGDRTAYFIIEVEVEPYLGPHNTVGKDRVLIELGWGDPPKVLKFEHLEDYPLPEHYNDYYLH